MVRPPRLKPITMRRGMIWVAIAALALGGWKIHSLREEYRRRAGQHAQDERTFLQYARRLRQVAPTYLKAIRATNETGLPVAIQADGEIAIAGREQGVVTMMMYPGGSDPKNAVEFDAETLSRFEDVKSADAAELERYRNDEVEPAEAMARYHGRLREKYERAAARPWLTVEPDQPPPQ